MMELIELLKGGIKRELSNVDLSSKSGIQIEKKVEEIIESIIGSTRIKKYGAHSFPDLVIDNHIGIEVKSSRSGLKGMGNSILESTRVSTVEKVFILFVYVGTPNEVFIANFEEVVSGVAITHSPRYMIDMSLASGQSFFELLNMTYDDFRSSENPVKIVYQYYKNKDKKSLPFWLDGLGENSQIASPVIRLATTSNINDLKPILFVYFPELIASGKPDKYDKSVLWLMREYSLVSPHFRDFFSAGGKVRVGHNGHSILSSKVIRHLFDSLTLISKIMIRIEIVKLIDAWGEDVKSEDIQSVWLEKALSNLKTHKDSKLLLRIFSGKVSETPLYFDEKCRLLLKKYIDIY